MSAGLAQELREIRALIESSIANRSTLDAVEASERLAIVVEETPIVTSGWGHDSQWVGAGSLARAVRW